MMVLELDKSTAIPTVCYKDKQRLLLIQGILHTSNVAGLFVNQFLQLDKKQFGS